MSRGGNCLDNAVAESFFGTMKSETLYGLPTPPTHDDARFAVHEYIQVFYNRRRLHSSLGYLTPAAFEERYLQQQQAADESAA